MGWLGAAAIVGIGLFSWSQHRATPTATLAPTVAPPAVAPSGSVQAQQVAAVEAVVAAKNAEASQQVKAFVDDGWTIVKTAPPDMALLSASPTLLPNREAELRAQLASAPPDKKFLSNVVTIATDAREPSTRVAAVEAIARMGAGDPQHALVSVAKKLSPNDPARRAAFGAMRPTNMTDAFVVSMAALLDDPAVLAGERKQLASTLAMIALRDRTSLPSDVHDSMSPAARALFDDSTRALAGPTGK